MDNFLLSKIVEDTPKINPDIANGLAVKHMAYTDQYVDNVFRAAARDFPKGLEYVSCQRCTPKEEYDFSTGKKNNKRSFDIARSDIYLMKYFFRFNGVMLPPRYLSLPFVSDAGFITLGGSRFVISPVLADKVISLATTSVFIRLLRDKLTFERAPHNIVINGQRELVQVVWSLIYHKPSNLNKVKATVKANCSLVHYLFCKYGFTKTFQMFAKCVPIVGGEDINKENYPEEDWVICESTTIKPKGSMEVPYYGTKIKLAIKKTDFTPFMKSLVAGFFYVVDHFPQRFVPSQYNKSNTWAGFTASYLDNTRLWMVLMGHILFSGAVGEGKLYADISEHFESLDEYIDSIVFNKLKDIGYECVDIYHLFAVAIENFNEWLLKAKDNINSMYDKELGILYFVLLGVTSAIFKLHFKLKKAAAKKPLTEKDITNIMNMILKPGNIYSITSQHNGVSTVSYSGDCKYFEITSMLIPQKTSNKSGAQNDRSALTDPAKRMHVSVAEVGGYLNFTKSDPSGRSQINPHITIDEKFTIVRDPAKIPILDAVQQMLKRD